MVGIVEEVGAAVTNVNPGDRVTVNVEPFRGECFFCQNDWVNNWPVGTIAERSKTASQALADLGYTNVYEFGGINTWPYDIE